MGLGSALQIGRSGLLTSQAAMQVVGHNLANVATEGYHRQTVALAPAGGQEIQKDVFIGRGVQLQAITRQIDQALESRLRGAIADQSHSLARQDLLRQVEAIQNEFSDVDLSTKLSAFFNSWSQLANNPQDLSLRTLVTEQAASLTEFIQGLRTDLTSLRTQVDQAAETTVAQVNSLLTQIEDLNHRVALQDHGTGTAAGLRDQRDALLGELSKYLDISTVEQSSGVVDVFVGSLPIVLNGDSRGVELKTTTEDGDLQIDLVLADDQSPLDISSGQLGAIVQFRKQDLAQAIDILDTFAGQLIWQVNRLHSQGQGTESFASVTGSVRVDDATAALNDDDAGLHFLPDHGSFQIHVTQQSTGQRITQTIRVDLDGIDAANDTTLTSLAADIDAINNISASVTSDGRLRITADGNDFQISFSDDTSGVLASLGVNTFFTGWRATDIDVNSVIIQKPALIAAAQGHILGDNRNALALAALRDQSVDELSGFSLSEYWNRHIEDFAIRLSQASQSVEADTVVRENLQAQQQSISGVNADEETINLIQYQRAYQASARFLSVVDEMIQTLLALL
jgi:flagellar hook-associated protein 1 FlgK